MSRSLSQVVIKDSIAAIDTCMKKISDYNLEHVRAGRSMIQKENYPSHLLQALFNQEFFTPESREWDCRASWRRRFNEEYTFECMTTGPVTIAPIPDEKKFYCRLHPTEHTQKGDEQIPSRDFLLSAYPWPNVFLIDSLNQLIEKQSELRDMWLKYIKAGSDIEDEVIIDLCLFGLSTDFSSGFREIISISDFLNIISCERGLSEAMKDRKFDGFAYAVLPKISTNAHSCSSLSKSISSSIKAKTPRTYIVFIDSLDLSILKETNFCKGLNSIRSITNKSINFENFTASGDWTYPCLHSMHIGSPAQFTFSNFRHDPYFRLLAPDILANMPKNMATHYVSQSILHQDTRIKSNSFLTRRISNAGYIQAAIKSSRNHGWRMGLTHSTDISFENCSIKQIPSHLESINKLVGESKVDTIFIDIDSLHRNDMFVRDDHQSWRVEPYEWTDDTPDKYERLLGIYADLDIEQRRYKDKIQMVDNILGELLNTCNPNDNIVIFSDHGTQYYPWKSDCPYEKPDDSTLSPERIWKPTLLVFAPGHKNFNGPCVSQELVSTCDLYNIILELHGLQSDPSLTDSQLPVALGGKEHRSSTTTFGLTVEANEVHPELSLPNRFEIVERTGANSGILHSSPALPLRTGNSINDLHQQMFPSMK